MMATDRTGYVFKDKVGRWYARVTITDNSGKRRNVKRRAVDRTDAKGILKKLLQQIEEEGSRLADASRNIFNDLAELRRSHEEEIHRPEAAWGRMRGRPTVEHSASAFAYVLDRCGPNGRRRLRPTER